MKKIKIASLLTAAALLISSFSTVAFAAEKTNNEKLDVVAEKIDWADSKWAAYESENYGSDYDQYMLTFTASGHALETALGTGFNKAKVSGTSITAYTVVVKLPETYVEGESFAMSLVEKAHSAYTPAALGNGYTYLIGNGTPMIPAAGEAKTVAEADKFEIAKVILSVAAGDEVKVSFAAECMIQDIKNDVAVDGTDITVKPAVVDSIDLPVKQPDPDPTEPTITGDDEGVAATGGKVWNNVVIEDVALGTNYRVQFTDGVDTSDERAIQGLEAAEINGDATFAVVLKTARNIADVVMNILYDIAD